MSRSQCKEEKEKIVSRKKVSSRMLAFKTRAQVVDTFTIDCGMEFGLGLSEPGKIAPAARVQPPDDSL